MKTNGTLCQAPVGFDIGCFRGDTLIPLVDGKSYPIQDLAERGEEILVYAIDADQRVQVAKATAKKTRTNAPLVRVTLDNGAQVVCTPDHEFMLRNGQYRRADTLEPGRSLMPFNHFEDLYGYARVIHPATGFSHTVHWIMARKGLLGDIPVFEGQRTVIHHKDFDPLNNLPSNLEFMGHRDHMKYHQQNGRHNIRKHREKVEAARLEALKRKAQTLEGHAYFAERGTRNILRYMEERPEHYKASVAGNGQRGKKSLVAYNRSEKGRAKSKEISNRLYTCETCGEKVKSGIGLHNHRRSKHGYNHKVISVDFLTEVTDVYCLTVPEYGNFALDAGVFVHNCGMMAFRSTVSKGKGYDQTLRQRFSERVLHSVGMGTGKGSGISFPRRKFEEIVRQGVNAMSDVSRENSERDYIPVDDDWDLPEKPVDRGIGQLGSLGSGNHFIELQHDQEDHLWVMVHTGSRGFGHGLASHFIKEGKEYLTKRGVDVRGGAEAVYFEPGTPLYKGYKNAVAAGANFAIANRLFIWRNVGRIFEEVFGEEPELVYEISHNLAQEEEVPGHGKGWVHRKGATRAFPAGHPMLKGTKWETTGHPILIPGSMGDSSYILYAEPGAEKSLYSVNHDCGTCAVRSRG